MKEYIKNIIAESLKDEVDVDREWERLFSSIEKKTISKMKTRRLFLQYMYLQPIVTQYLVCNKSEIWP